MSGGLLATVLISTKDRRELVHTTLLKLRELDGYDRVKVVVTDDGSAENVREKLEPFFPEVQFHRYEISQGLIAQRNRMIREAAASIIISLDDESYPLNKDAFLKIEELFRKYPKAGILNFTVVLPGEKYNLLSYDKPYQAARFIGCAHALRKSFTDQFDQLYDPVYVRQGEERDAVIQCLDAGFDVIHVDQIKVFHDYYPGKRNWKILSMYEFRNQLFLYLKFFPGILIVPAMLHCSAVHLIYCLRRGLIMSWLEAFSSFFNLCGVEWKRRRPVSVAAAWKYVKRRKTHLKEYV